MSVKSFLVDAFYSLSANVNKRRGDSPAAETAEGVIGARLPELELDLDDQKLVDLSNTWERNWNDSDVKSKWEAMGDENERYWVGDHYNRPELDKSRAIKDNAIFEGLETYLPQVTRRNPEAMVSLASGIEQTQPNQDYAHALQLELGELADTLKLRLKLKGAARHWSIRGVGALKFGWDLDNDTPAIKNIRPPKLILDPEATTDEDGYTGERIGEHRKLPAWKIVALIEKDPKSKDSVDYITNELAHGDMATEIGFIEWWTADYMFWKLNSKVLLKRKNPHWNYDVEAPVAPQQENQLPQAETPAQAPEATPELPQGAPALPQLTPEQQAPQPAQNTKGINHFKTRKMPYLILSVFNLGKQPVDVTTNISQNLSNQDLINKRIKQIDKNADTANNGMVVSLERAGLTKDQASGVTKALRNGGVVAIPTGAPQEAIYKPPMSELPQYVYNQLVDTRNRVRDIWGTRGSSPAGTTAEKTVRGKIISQGQDTDRIGGGISEYLEQLGDDAYNWIVQLLYVYDDRFVEQWANGLVPPKVKVSVKEGSLLPKDSTTIANQAISLAEAGKMAMIDMYKRLDYPNPEELAANVWLEVNAPDVLFANDPRIKQVMEMKAQQAQAAAGGEKKAPSESISFKDLPPEGKAQMAKQAGIDLHPEAIAAHDEHSKPAQPVIPGQENPIINPPQP
jgi:hypothetical protein